ncbi:MAG TPA: hypothetical protein VMM93_05920 [Vicinamibacterales bacterium]|nr:hypothetical protein [Vicinamibacterales bacterium]
MNTATGVFVVGLTVAGVAGVTWSLAGTSASDVAAQSAATLTGCLRTGSASTVFILRGASAGESGGPPRDHLLVDAAEGVDLSAHVNRRVAITGPAWGPGEGPSPPSAANTAERALRRQSVTSLREVASDCSNEPL